MNGFTSRIIQRRFTIFLSLLLLAYIPQPSTGNQIIQNGIISHCGSPVHLESFSCENCNFGETATMTGIVSGCSDAVSEGGSISATFVAMTPMFGQQEMELFQIDDIQCGVDQTHEFAIPELPQLLQSLAMGKVQIHFFETTTGTQVGCSTVPLARGIVAVTKIAALATAGVGMSLIFSYYIYNKITLGNGSAAIVSDRSRYAPTATSSSFMRMTV